MQKIRELYEGKAKKVYETDQPDLYIVSYKDDATAFNGEKKGTIAGKGVINNKMSNIMFRYLAENGIATHYVEQLSDRETAVKKVEIIPLEVIVRNIAAGSFSMRYGVAEGTPLKTAVVEFSYKNDALGDPLINNTHIEALDLATKDEIDFLERTALRVNELMRAYFLEKGITLVDFKIEFGRTPEGILLADEISPDTCRFWDVRTGEKLDKDRFRRDLGGVEQAYEEVFGRVSKDLS